MHREINIKYIDMPQSTKAMTVLKDDAYTVFLNARMSHEQLAQSYRHELGHITKGDFDKQADIDLIELWGHM